MTEYKVALLFGGPSAEHSVSLMSARSVFASIEIEGIHWHPIAVSKGGYWLDQEISQTILKEEYSEVSNRGQERYDSKWMSIKKNLSDDIDIVFSLLHGPYGEDGTVQGFLETVDIPYVGCNVVTSAVCMNKIFAKDILAQNGFPQPQYITISQEDFRKSEAQEKLIEEIVFEINLPCFIKPASLGSSLGINKVKNKSEILGALKSAMDYDERVIIEQAVEGREIECSVLGNDKEYRASLPGEIIPGREFYDYEAKYFSEDTELLAPAELNQEISTKIRNLAVDAFRLLGGEGLARVDFFLTRESRVLINEINTIPGFTDRSMYPKMWQATGFSYNELVKRLIKNSLKNNGLKQPHN